MQGNEINITSRDAFAQQYDTIPCGIAQFLASSDAEIINANKFLIKLLGFTDTEFWGITRYFGDFVSHDEGAQIAAKLAEWGCRGAEATVTLEYELIKKDGSTIWVHDETQIINVGNVIIYQCVFTDITKRKKAEKELKLSEEQYRLAIKSAKCDVFIYDIAHNVMVYRDPLNDFAERRESPENYVEQGRIAKDSIDKFNNFIVEMRTGVRNGGCELCLIDAKNDTKWIEASFHMQFEESGVATQAVCCFSDITMLKRKEILLYEISRQDALTGLLNRSAFEQEVAQALNNKKPSKNAFLMLDLDSFKSVNDKYGHAFGDELLICASDIIRECTKKTDIIARLGGDEFAIFMRNISSADKALKLGKELCDRFAKYSVANKNKVLSCSIGVAVSPLHGKSFRTIYDKADIALYNSKHLGKNRCCIYTSGESGRNTTIFDELRLGFSDLPLAFIILEVIFDNKNKPVRYEYKFSNKANAVLFAIGDGALTKDNGDIFGASDLFSLDILGEIAQKGGQKNITKYSERLKKWLMIQIYQPQKGFCACILNDITNKIEEDINFKSNEERLRLAVEYSATYIWEYDVLNNTIFLPEKVQKALNVSATITDITSSVFLSSAIDANSIEDFVRLHTDIIKGAGEATADILFINANGRQSWQRLHYKTIYSDNAKTVRAVGFSEDLNDIKAAEFRFEEENAYRSAVSQELWASIKFNITNRSIEDCKSEYLGDCAEKRFSNIDEFGDELCKNILEGTEKTELKKLLTTEQLLKCYNEGNNHIVIEHTLLSENKLKYLKSTINIRKQPNSKAVIAFFYASDITDERTINRAINAIVNVDYDYIAFVNTRTNTYVRHTAAESNTPSPPLIADDFAASMTQFIHQYVVPEDRERVLAATQYKNMIPYLDKYGHIDLFYALQDERGNKSYKKIKIAYLDKSNGMVFIARTDVTSIYNESEAKNTILKNALLSAEQANNAKTEFLSQMSHEVRTPLNAILGMVAIARESSTPLEEHENCLNKIYSSANYLLSLINNILDMSRIESGKLINKHERINFNEFINGINAKIYSSASAKGIDYIVTAKDISEKFYLGDSAKLEQILFNLLSNAVKYTPSCGKVHLDISQTKNLEHSVILKFVISDNGVGIKQDFLSHIFEPFMQAGGDSFATYTGAGLGLAIAKNLVALVDGKISVESTVGCGTKFVFQVPLGICDKEESKDEHENADFAGLSLLIVDCDTAECGQLQTIMAECGMHTSCVNSKQKATDFIAQKMAVGNAYDFIIINYDIEKGGLKPLKEIREIADPEKTTIIIAANEPYAIEKQALLYGANFVTNKPILKSNIISLLNSARTSKKAAAPHVAESGTIDFTNKRILLVEDHPINIEVAQRLLLKKNCAVEVAKNGLIALEKFSASAVSYYDAILMDIRMPLMDGLTATQKIRGLTRADAASVPIVAMTANAFDADLDKSVAAGMNAHLNKPIEPKLLYSTLDNLINKKRN